MKKIYIVILFIVIFFCFSKTYYANKVTFINMRDLSKQIDKNNFYNNSLDDLDVNEAFVVEFNESDSNGNNTGFIDIDGNTSRYFQYTEKLHPYILKTFSGLYKISENEYINTMLEKVTDEEKISKAEKEEEEYYLNSYIDITHLDEGKRINGYIESKISGTISKIEKHGTYYLVTFSKGFFGLETYNFFCDNRGNIVANMIFNAQDMVQIPKNENEIGCFLYEGFGKVYFNTSGDIIWITYNS